MTQPIQVMTAIPPGDQFHQTIPRGIWPPGQWGFMVKTEPGETPSVVERELPGGTASNSHRRSSGAWLLRRFTGDLPRLPIRNADSEPIRFGSRGRLGHGLMDQIWQGSL